MSRNELKRFWVLADPDIWNSYQFSFCCRPPHVFMCICWLRSTIFPHQKFLKNFSASLEFRGWTAG
ncbi:ORF908 [White spot syndrome virus]|uniref:ORF908 n=1 Tax=White spot syndrome virus TaxID=342409 RepID=A0A2D3I6R7_9VIRU|nr:ORF908 [White spot syndrome virus]